MTAHVELNGIFKTIQSAAICVAQATDVSDACNAVAGLLRSQGWKLFLVAGEGPAVDGNSTVYFSAVEDVLEQATLRMCADDQLPIRMPDAFEPVSIQNLIAGNAVTYDAGLCDYLSALSQAAQDRQMFVVSARLGTMDLNFFIGCEKGEFDQTARHQLASTVSHFAASLVARFAENRGERATYDVDGEAIRKNLSKRERECLLWCANGKSSYEISRILTLSEHTVNRYLGMVCDKLDAVNRPHAVSKAIKLGLIDLSIIS